MKAQHLDEDQIIVSIVDENDLPEKLRSHLESCPACRERRGAFMARLEGIGHRARELAPRPRGMSLPQPKVSWGFAFRWPVVATGLASLVIIAAVWGMLVFRGTRIEMARGPEPQQVVGLTLIEDILEESALPAHFQDMALVSFDYFDDAFIDFVVPIEGSNGNTMEDTSSNKYNMVKKEA